MPDRGKLFSGLHGQDEAKEQFRAGSDEMTEAMRYIRALRLFGTPEQLGKKLTCLDKLIEEKDRRDWLILAIKTVAGWTTVVAAGWMAIRGFLNGLAK